MVTFHGFSCIYYCLEVLLRPFLSFLFAFPIPPTNSHLPPTSLLGQIYRQHPTSPLTMSVERLPPPPKPPMTAIPPRFLIIGAGSRGHAYAKNISPFTNGLLASVCDPLPFARKDLGEKYIWGAGNTPSAGQSFACWTDFVAYEDNRRIRASRREEVPEGVDGVFICVQDELHKPVILGLAHLNLHIMCEKPLATNLQDCIDIYRSINPARIFSIGHVLRYSPHNVLLRKLLLEDKVIGDICSVNHTEPVGYWHFAHSFVRGNWRDSTTSAPSLLTKSCHDIDILLWLLCSSTPSANTPSRSSSLLPHLPSTISSSGGRNFFTKSRKPAAAGSATNCLSCAHEEDCMFSAKKIYLGSSLKGFQSGNAGWPVKIVVPDIEDIMAKAEAAPDGAPGNGQKAGEEAILAKLKEDWGAETTKEERKRRQYYGRCVWEADNDVCDDQVVQMHWEEEGLDGAEADSTQNDGIERGVDRMVRSAKNATFHMVAMTAKICQRYTMIYGTTGEVYADSSSITVTDFTKPVSNERLVSDDSALAFETTTYHPHVPSGGHGGGDSGLARQFVLAVSRVKAGEDAKMAQWEEIGCDAREVVLSHAAVFAAEEARIQKIVVDFPSWLASLGL